MLGINLSPSDIDTVTNVGTSAAIIFSLLSVVTGAFPVINKRFFPLIAIFIGIGWTLLQAAAEGEQLTAAVVVAGIIAGLDSTGLNEARMSVFGRGSGSGYGSGSGSAIASDSASASTFSGGVGSGSNSSFVPPTPPYPSSSKTSLPPSASPLVDQTRTSFPEAASGTSASESLNPDPGPSVQSASSRPIRTRKRPSVD